MKVKDNSSEKNKLNLRRIYVFLSSHFVYLLSLLLLLSIGLFIKNKHLLKLEKTENNRLVDENTSLVDEKNSLVDENNRLVDEKNSLVDENNSLVDENTSLLGEKKTFIEQMKEHEERLNTFNQNNIRFEKKIVDIQTEKQQILLNNNLIEDRNKKLHIRNANLEEQNRNLREENSILKNRINDMEHRLIQESDGPRQPFQPESSEGVRNSQNMKVQFGHFIQEPDESRQIFQHSSKSEEMIQYSSDLSRENSEHELKETKENPDEGVKKKYSGFKKTLFSPVARYKRARGNSSSSQ